MKKLILIASMAIVIIAQVFVLGHFFIDRYSIVLNGDKFKFLVTNLDLSNAKKKGYIKFELDKKISGKGEYGVIHEDKGYAILDHVTIGQPTFEAYLQNSEDGYFKFPYERYYLKDIIEDDERIVLPNDRITHINVRIKDGKVELIDLMVNGEKIENYIE